MLHAYSGHRFYRGAPQERDLGQPAELKNISERGRNTCCQQAVRNQKVACLLIREFLHQLAVWL